MEVTTRNLEKVLPTIREKISNCHFLAVDCEFTGLCANAADSYSLLDSPEQRYSKLCRSVRQFTLCQIGVTTFTNEPWQNKYTACPFTFYLFPQDCGGHDLVFSVQASSVSFLCEHNFDFNKCMYDGISYMNREQEAEARRVLSTTNEVKQQAIEKEILNAVGFRQVFTMMVESQKPLVGHNLLMDLMFFYDKFHKSLPSSYAAFKSEMHGLFPTIIDTKRLCFALRKKVGNNAENLLRQNTLPGLHQALSSDKCQAEGVLPPSIVLAESCEQFIDSSSYHDAGFDAYASGVVIIRMVHLFARQSMSAGDSAPTSWSRILHLIHPHVNQVNLIRGPVKWINMAGPDPEVDCSWLTFSSQQFFGSIDKQEVLKSVLRYGTVDVDVQDNYRCIVAFGNHTLVDEALADLADHPRFAVSRYRPPFVSSTLAAVVTCSVAVSVSAGAAYVLLTGNSVSTLLSKPVSLLWSAL